MKVGDQVTMKHAAHSCYLNDSQDPVVYTVLEITDVSVSVKHPNIGGYFVFSKDMVAEVVEEYKKEQS